VNERVAGAGDVIQPDWVNNKNRQYKPPLSIHADHDAVVTPIATDEVRYELRPFEAVDNALIEQAVNWADDLTRVAHTDCVESLVATLWPDLYEDHDGWRATLEAWIEAERERERDRQRQRESALQRREERLAELDGTLEGRPITPFKEDVYEAVENIDIGEIARHYASDAYNTDPNQPRPQFDPSWRHSESGQSCFVDEQANTFGDSKVNAGGGPAKLMALATGIISDADADLDGEDYWAAVDELRSTGYDIPVWVPEAGSDRVDGETYDQMPFWAVRKAAVALEICPEDAFVDRECEDGTYEGFPGYRTYNAALKAIEDAGLNHGRKPVTPDEKATDDESESATDPSGSDDPPGDLDQAHLREKNRLLTAKVERLESELAEKTERIEDLESEVERLRSELNTVCAERDRQATTLDEHEPEQESDRESDDEDPSLLDQARRFVSFGQ
jgi:putative DNA primase/helicase